MFRPDSPSAHSLERSRDGLLALLSAYCSDEKVKVLKAGVERTGA
jgi:hypothetical protein